MFKENTRNPDLRYIFISNLLMTLFSLSNHMPYYYPIDDLFPLCPPIDPLCLNGIITAERVLALKYFRADDFFFLFSDSSFSFLGWFISQYFYCPVFTRALRSRVVWQMKYATDWIIWKVQTCHMDDKRRK